MSSSKQETVTMSAKGWTPGPWVSEHELGPVNDWRDKANIGIWSVPKFEFEKRKLSDDDDIEEASDMSWICGIWGTISGEDKSNANLIAAAPDLYDALDDLVTSLTIDDEEGVDIFGTGGTAGGQVIKEKLDVLEMGYAAPQEGTGYWENNRFIWPKAYILLLPYMRRKGNFYPSALVVPQ